MPLRKYVWRKATSMIARISNMKCGKRKKRRGKGLWKLIRRLMSS